MFFLFHNKTQTSPSLTPFGFSCDLLNKRLLLYVTGDTFLPIK